ncbi:hypothetical protein EGW08_009459 [Elysia chlorotica]|uniref:Uncharacterized protein n=1 Tax=Elysia chlorotica TaxID=188477 RepID=A0A3S1A4X6_ELYCH|nr:hypothetical protein EGW08_009459 [Elysia chlorotica]
MLVYRTEIQTRSLRTLWGRTFSRFFSYRLTTNYETASYRRRTLITSSRQGQARCVVISVSTLNKTIHRKWRRSLPCDAMRCVYGYGKYHSVVTFSRRNSHCVITTKSVGLLFHDWQLLMFREKIENKITSLF